MKINLQKKLLGSYLIIGLIPIIITSITVFIYSQNLIEKMIVSKLEATTKNKKVQIEDFFKFNEFLATDLAGSPTVKTAFTHVLPRVLTLFKDGISGEDILDDETYEENIEVTSDFLGEILFNHKLYDILLIGSKGDIFYTASEEADFGTNLTGINSPLTTAFNKVMETKKSFLSDIQKYSVVDNVPSQFFASPVIIDEELVGVVAIQISNDSINRITLNIIDEKIGTMNRKGLGKTQESYLVGMDKLARSNSYLNDKFTLDNSFKHGNKIDTVQANLALNGKTGTFSGKNYLNHKVISSYDFINVGNKRWALISEIGSKEAFGPIYKMGLIILGIFILLLIAILFFGKLIAKTISGPILNSVKIVKRIAKGEFPEFEIKRTGDEIEELNSSIKDTITVLKKASFENKRMIRNLEMVPAPILEVDKEMNITFMNNTGASIVGLEPSECVGKKCYDLFKTGDCNTERCATKRSMELGEMCESETVARPSQDVATPIKYTGLPIKNHKGEITGGLEVIFNMSDIYSVANRIDDSKNTLVNIGESLNKSVTTMSSSAEELSAQTSSVAGVAEQFITDSKIMSNDAESVSNEISKVSKSTTEINENIENANDSVSSLITSINDISKMIDHEDQIVEEAADNSKEILNSMGELVSLSKSIGEFVDIISGIAEQTNLLALNATIEAARAGEAGKGFAVVANEVKELSNMTENTTNDIASKVSEIQLAVNNSEGQVNKIANILEQIRTESGAIKNQTDAQLTTSKSMEEAMGTVVNSIKEITKGVNLIGGKAEGITKVAKDSTTNAEAIGQSIKEVNQAGKDVNSDALALNKKSDDVTNLINSFSEIVNEFQLLTEMKK